MTYNDLLVLIPGHTLDDFPTELGEKPAAGLLNAFAVIWHPVLLAEADRFPRWQRADELTSVDPHRMVIIPTACGDQVPSAFLERAQREGMNIVHGITDREEMIAAALKPIPDCPQVDPDLVADFLALGHLYLQTEVLTRHMRQWGNIDESHMQREAVSAATAAIQNDHDTARKHLKHCFDMLFEARERFYPVECYLLELCLVLPRLADDHLERLLQSDTPFSLMVTAADLDAIASQRETFARALRDRVDAGSLDIIGGELHDDCSPLLSLGSTLWNLEAGRELTLKHLNQAPTTWGRRRFGLTPQTPQLIKLLGYQSALHFVMDDGLYPDEEFAKLQWQGYGTRSIEAFSRIPLAADSASSFLRFPVRMAESMDNDHVAAVVFARWPEVRSPWLEDFRRATRYAPVVGRFGTFRQFFSETSFDGRLSEFPGGNYLTPFLVQSVARREPRPVSRYVDYWKQQRQWQQGAFAHAITQLLKTGRITQTHADLRRQLELSGPDLPDPDLPDADAPTTSPPVPPVIEQDVTKGLATFCDAGLNGLQETLLKNAPQRSGLLIVNPLAFSRRAVVEWPESLAVPPPDPPIVGRQFVGGRRQIQVDLPPCGYVWLPGDHPAASLPPMPKIPTAEEFTLRNDLFEVTLSERTGGIASIKPYTRGPNRLSQQLALRFPREKTYESDPETGATTSTWYSAMRLRESRILATGPMLGSIETVGDLVDPTDDKLIGTYRQTVSVWRGSPIIEVDVEIGLEQAPEGDPWSNYVAARFAWSDPDNSLTRSTQEGSQEVLDRQTRIEAPSYLEIANESGRTTILTGGLSFHRKIEDRMLDTILVTEGEALRRFRFGIAIDHSFPMQAALDFESAPLSTVVSQGPPPAGAAGWLLQIPAKNVQLLEILPHRPVEATPTNDQEAPASPVSGCLLRLLETEGQHKKFPLRSYRPIKSAIQVDLLGNPLHTCTFQEGTPQIDIAPYELCDINIEFA
ncbi:MAG: hypothetical protein R3C01_00290 [Planctomycetaceae bacterium]